MVFLIYFPIALISFIVGGILAVKSKADTQDKTIISVNPTPNNVSSNSKLFIGTITYEAKAEGSNKEGVELFKIGAPTKIIVSFGDSIYAQEEYIAESVQKAIINLKTKECFYLDFDYKTATKANYSNLEDTPENVRLLLPYSFKTDLEATEETETVNGLLSKKYKIIKSGFLRPGATGFIWINESIQLPKWRFDIQTKSKRITSPLPISIPISKGIITKAIINENETIVTYTITELNASAPSKDIFEIPKTFTLITD